MKWELGINICTLLMYEIGNWGEPTVKYKELCSALCTDLMGKKSKKE